MRPIANSSSFDLSAFAKRHRLYIACLGLPLAAVMFSNWYFSPEHRLRRLADNVLEIGLPEISDDITTAMSAFSATSGGATRIYSSCAMLPVCELSLDMQFPMSADIHRSTMYLSVRADVTPVIEDSGWLNIFPPKIKWRPVSWQWNVKVQDAERPDNTRFYTGTFSDIGGLPEFGNRAANARILRGMGNAIQKQLVQE